MSWIDEAINSGKKIKSSSALEAKEEKILESTQLNRESQKYLILLEQYHGMHIPAMSALTNEMGTHPHLELTHIGNSNFLIPSYEIPKGIADLIHTSTTTGIDMYDSSQDYAAGTRWNISVYDAPHILQPPRTFWKPKKEQVVGKPQVILHILITLYNPAKNNTAINLPLIGLKISNRGDKLHFTSVKDLKNNLASLLINTFKS